MKKEKATPKSSPNKTHKKNNSIAAQRKRLLEALRDHYDLGLTTIQLREQFDIMAPAPRIYELRWGEGHNIQTIPDSDRNAQDNKHRCARYILRPGKWQGVVA